jgi:lactoylglutathione lyase
MTQLKVGLRVADLETSCAVYLRLGFRQIPRPDEPRLRYLTFGHTWMILSDRFQHGYHSTERRDAALSGPREPQDAYWARIFYGLDPDGYGLMFEQHHAIKAPVL